MAKYLYHGSPLELKELKEPYEGRGVFLTPSQALAAMFGVMRDVKTKTDGFGRRWAMDLFEDYDKTGNDKPRAFTAYSDKEDMPETHDGADVYIHKIKMTPEIRKKLHQRLYPFKTSKRHEVIYAGELLPVESVEKVHIPYTAKYSPEVAKYYGDTVKSGSSKLFSEINDLMDGYEWEAIDPVTGKKIYSPGKGFFTTSNPVSYSYKGGGEKPFKGNCVEQSLFVREHYPDAKILFSRDAKPGVNNIHVTPLLQDDKGYYHHVKLHPVKDKKGIPQYLSGGRFRNLRNFLKGTAHKWGDRDIDYYVLNDIPPEGDATSLFAYANEHADPLRIRDGKPLEKFRFKKNFQKIVDAYKDRFGIDLSHVKYFEDTYPRNTDGNFTGEFSSKESGGNWHSDHSISINPKMEEVIKHWKLNTKLQPFVDWMIAHELAHDVEKNQEHQDLVKKMLEEAKDKKFTTAYLEKAKRRRKAMETFCEYMAHKINQKKEAAAKEEVLQGLADELQRFKHNYDAPEFTQTLAQMLKEKKTNCWGVSRLALNRLRKGGLDPETVFVYEDETPMLPTHQFTTFKDGDKYRVHDFWFNDREQIGDAFDSREEAIDDRVKKWRKEENHYNPVQVYTGTHLPRVGVDAPEYMYRIMNLAKHLKTYPKMKKESAVKRSGLGPFGKGMGVPNRPESNYHGNSLNSVVYTMRNYRGAPNKLEQISAKAGLAGHSVTFATLDEATFKKLEPEQKANWIMYNPKWNNPKSTDTPYYFRPVAYTADNAAKGLEAVYPIISHIAGVTPGEKILAQKFDPITGKFKNYYYSNNHGLEGGVYTPLKTRAFGDMAPGQFYNSAMDWLAERCKCKDMNSTCHKITANLYKTMPHLMPGIFSLGGLKGGFSVSKGAPLSQYPLINLPGLHPTSIYQWDDGKAFDPNSLQAPNQ